MSLSANSDAVTYAKAANARTAAETGDRIEWVKLSLAFLPLATPVSDAKVLTGRQKPLTEVAIIIAEIRSRDGFEGVGFSYSKRAGGQGIYAHAKELADNLLGEDPNDIDKIYTKLLWAGASVGRSGMAVQAISPIDIALWDMKAKRAGLPLAKLLGAHRDSVQCYNTSGGFLHTPLDQVLKNRQGSAVSLGAILLWVAHRLDIPLVPVIFPTQMLLRAEWLDGEMWLINPFNGDTLDDHTLDVWLKGNISPMAELYNEDLDEADNAEVVRKLLDTLKSALMEERQMELALRASEVLLQFNPEDPYEIRDRGLIYVQLECDHVALTDLSYFVEQCPEDPISEMIRAQINSIAHKQITLH